MKPLRVLQLIDSLNIGGAEMMAVNIANGLSEVGVESYLCVTRKEGALKSKLNKEVKYLFLNKKMVFDVQAILRLKTYLKNNNINIIHAHSSSFFLASLMKFLRPSLKICWHDHYGYSDDIESRKYFVLKQFSRFFCHIFVVNNKLEIWAKSHLKNNQISFLPNFADLSNEKITFLNGVQGKRIVCSANLRTQKDHLNLLKAFSIVLHELPDWSLHLIGKDYHDLYAQVVKDFIMTEQLSKNVFLYDTCLDIKHILSQATIGVLSSKSEGLPVSLLEYGLTKLPVVCTDVGECASVITHNFSGYIVPPQNPNELAFYLSKLAKSKENQVRFGTNLYLNIRANYSKENVIKSVLKIYKNCLPIQNT